MHHSINKKIILAFFVLLTWPFGNAEIYAKQPLNPQSTAVRYVYSPSVKREMYPWLQEQVAATWFQGINPKLCHICDNVYRYPVDNGSIITRGILNMTNRKKLASIMEVKSFLSIVFRQNGELIRVESSLFDLKQKDPLEAKVFTWSKPWSFWEYFE